MPSKQPASGGLWNLLPAEVAKRFQPIVAQIAEGAVEREQQHVLPRAEVRLLAEAGFGALRLPVADGGAGLSIPQLAALLIELGAADSNLPQIFRGHIAFVEDRLVSAAGAERDAWLARFAAGEIVGNAWSETGGGALGRSQTTLTEVDGRVLLNGRKFYTTGSIFSDWIDVTAFRDDGVEITALVRADQAGVDISDDWDGFGQQLTGTGGIVFTDAVVESAHVHAFAERFRYQTALYQLVLLSVLAGIVRAAERDAGEQLRTRARVYSHGAAPLAREDPQLLAVLGEVSAQAFVAEAAALRVAELVQAAADTAGSPGSEEDRAANVAAEIASAQAQVVLSRSVPIAATAVFDTLGASSIRKGAGLDRHWRNARAVSSHNPHVYKARIVGDWSVNGTEPPFLWSIGVHPAAPEPPEPAAPSDPAASAAPDPQAAASAASTESRTP